MKKMTLNQLVTKNYFDELTRLEKLQREYHKEYYQATTEKSKFKFERARNKVLIEIENLKNAKNTNRNNTSIPCLNGNGNNFS